MPNLEPLYVLPRCVHGGHRRAKAATRGCSCHALHNPREASYPGCDMHGFRQNGGRQRIHRRVGVWPGISGDLTFISSAALAINEESPSKRWVSNY